MKRFLAVIIALSFCLSLAACGGSAPEASSAAPVSSAAPTAESKSAASSSAAAVSEPAKAEPKPAAEADKPVQSEPSLPINFGEGYSCTLDGFEGYVTVSEYSTEPDEMNPGSEIRTASVKTVFNNVPADFSASAVMFPLSGTPTMLDEAAYLVEMEDGDGLIFVYDNMEISSQNQNGVYTNEMLISYVVPETYDDLAFAIVNGKSNSTLDSITIADIVSADTRWFIMGSLDNGMLSYNGAAIDMAASDCSVAEVFGAHASEFIPEMVPEEPAPAQTAPAQSASSGQRHIRIIREVSVLKNTENGRSTEFGPMTVIDYGNGHYQLSVTVNYSGVPAGGVVDCFLFDALEEVHIDRQENSASGSGSTEFVFEADSITPPFTFSAGIIANGSYSNNIHVDIELV